MSTTQFSNNIDSKLLTQAIAEFGYILIENAIPESLLEKLYLRIHSLDINKLNDSKVGRATKAQKQTEIRSDKTFWLEETHNIDQEFLEVMNNLRTLLNEQLFLGLFDYECHYSVYQPGCYYSKHLDVLANKSTNSSDRILSSVLYLNKNWEKHQGGELILYSKDNTSIVSTITPHYGSLLLFLSSEFPHEVTPTAQIRYSIAGWFRARN